MHNSALLPPISKWDQTYPRLLPPLYINICIFLKKVHFWFNWIEQTKGDVAPKTALPYGTDSCIAWNRCHIFTNKRGTYGIIADDLRFTTQLSNVYGNAIRAKLAAAQTTRSVAGSFSSFVTQNLQCICSLYHRHPRFFHKSPEFDSMQCMNPRHSPRPMPKAVFISPVCGKAKEKSRTFLQRTTLERL